MKLTARDVAKLIDISAVQAPHGATEIRNLVRNAKEFHFMAVHVLPCWVTFLKELLADSPDILIGAPVGFPSGAHRTEIKVAEARLLLQDGVQEMDMMLNVGKLRSGEYRYCEEEIRAVVREAADVPVKVILEVHYLSRDQLKKACEAVHQRGGRLRQDGHRLGRERRHPRRGAVHHFIRRRGHQGEGRGQHPQPRNAGEDAQDGSVAVRHQPQFLDGDCPGGGGAARGGGRGMSAHAISRTIIAYDLGTGGAKASLYQVDGTCLASTFVSL